MRFPFSFWQVTGGGASVPTVSAIVPNIGDTAGGGGIVTITGTNFTGATGVTLGGTSATSVVVVNPTTITCIPGAHASGGSLSVLVTTPGGTNGANAFFEYWTPSQITGSPLWYDAERGVTQVANAVSAWAEQTAGVVNAAQATGANKPTWTASVFGTLHSLRFAKAGPSFMTVTAQTVVSTGAVTMRAGIKSTDATATATGNPGVSPANTIMAGSGGGGASNFGMGGDGTAGTVNSRSYDGGAWQLASGGTSVNDGNPHIIGLNIDGTSKVLQTVKDGANVGAAGTLGVGGFSDGNGWDSIGCGFGNVDTFAGDVAWILWLPSAISGGDETKLNAWSKQRWGTP